MLWVPWFGRGLPSNSTKNRNRKVYTGYSAAHTTEAKDTIRLMANTMAKVSSTSKNTRQSVRAIMAAEVTTPLPPRKP